MVIERVPSVEMVRFVSSGTEACLSVLRLMRAYTKREKIIKFVGCYHGHADSFLVKAGSGVWREQDDKQLVPYGLHWLALRLAVL